jgi:hypothetical protein
MCCLGTDISGAGLLTVQSGVQTAPRSKMLRIDFFGRPPPLNNGDRHNHIDCKT